jgi:DNA-binding transcriptional regulator YhcF (GntR family)
MFSVVRDAIWTLSGIEIKLLDNHYLDQFKLSLIQKKKLTGFLADVDNQVAYIAHIGTLDQTPKQFIKFDDNIKEKLGLRVIYWFDQLTTQNKRALIKYRIPFLLSDKDLFLPFNYLRVTKEPRVVNEEPKITPAIQEVLIAIMLYRGEKLIPRALSEALEIPPVTVYRAFQVLENLGYIKTQGATRNKTYSLNMSFDEFVQNAMNQLTTPITQEYTLEFEEQLELLRQVGLMLAGDTALALVTQVNAVSEQTYAVWKKQFKIIEKNEQWKIGRKPLREPIKLQIWSYNPDKLAQIQRGEAAEVVDSLSLALSTPIDHDPRLEQAYETLLSEVDDTGETAENEDIRN